MMHGTSHELMIIIFIIIVMIIIILINMEANVYSLSEPEL